MTWDPVEYYIFVAAYEVEFIQEFDNQRVIQFSIDNRW